MDIIDKPPFIFQELNSENKSQTPIAADPNPKKKE
jgi:hypothetical protein